MVELKLEQLNWTTIGFLTQSLLLVLALIDVDLVRFLIFRLGLLLILIAAGFFFLVKHGRRSRLWLAGQLLKNQDKILGGASKVFTLTPTKTALAYFGILSKLVAKPKLWELQPIIPKLPVPPLSQTCATYLKTLKPILTEEQFQNSTRVVQEFQAPGGLGEQLNQALVARAQDPNIDNWLEEMWETFAYLYVRAPLPLSSNWYGVDRPHPLPHDKISRAANTAAAILSFKEMIDKEELEPVLLYNAVPLCMEQYRRMFNTSRIPIDPIDKIVHKPEARHMVVYYQGQLFNFKAYNPNGTPLTRDQFAHTFKSIVELVDKTPSEQRQPSLGPLTAQDRNTWAKWRARLIADGNTEQLDIIESAIVLFVLEDESPDTTQALADRASKGNPDNRWFDKSGTFIFWDNGRFSGNFEHTWGDAPVMVNLITYMFGVEDSKSGLERAGPSTSGSSLASSSSSSNSPLPPPPVQIKFNLSDDVVQQIEVAKQEYQEKVVENGVELYVLEFDQFGKNLIKNAKLSPDGFVQMALQLAYYSRHNKLCLTYESSHTRIFRKGRTETVRSASSDALAFVQSMHDPDAGDFQRILLLRKAVNAHIAYMRQAMSGNGVDRHLMGLYVVASQMGLVGEKTPPIFRDAGYQLNYQLSTSQTPGYQTGGGGFNPTDVNGYGSSYVVNDDTLVFHISAWKSSPETSAEGFANSLSESLMAMRAVLLTDSQMRRNLSHSKLVQMAQLDAD